MRVGCNKHRFSNYLSERKKIDFFSRKRYRTSKILNFSSEKVRASNLPVSLLTSLSLSLRELYALHVGGQNVNEILLNFRTILVQVLIYVFYTFHRVISDPMVLIRTECSGFKISVNKEFIDTQTPVSFRFVQ